MGKPSRAQQQRRRQPAGGTGFSFTSDIDTAEPDSNPLEGLWFDVDGERFDCEGDVNHLEASELAAAATAGVDPRSPAGYGIIAQFLGVALGPVEYMRYKAHVQQNKTPVEVSIAIMNRISERLEVGLEQATGRPTGPPPRSSGGRAASAERRSLVISLQHGDVTEVPPTDPRVAGAGDPTT